MKGKIVGKMKYLAIFVLIISLVAILSPSYISAGTADQAQTFVTRFYVHCLGRQPDQTGLNQWVTSLLDGSKTGEDVAKGFILAWEFNLAGFGYHFPCGWLDIVHIHGLTTREAKELAHFASFSAKKRGWIALQTPYIPYFDPKPLKKAKFIFYPKTLHLDMMLLEDIDFPEKIESFYFDWR